VNTPRLQPVASVLLLFASSLHLGCGVFVNDYVFDPEVLAQAAQQAVGLSGDEMFDAVQEALAEAYPDRIANPGDGQRDWILNDDQGVPGQLIVLYHSAREYLIFVGSPTGAEWSLGPSTDAEFRECQLLGAYEIRDFVLEGELWSYDRWELEAQPYDPGAQVVLQSCGGKGYRMSDDGAWMLEYGRGNLPSTLYEHALLPESPLAGEIANMSSYIISEIIRNLVNDALGVGGSSLGRF